MQLIGGTAPKPSPFPPRKGAWRLRPGEAPSWVDMPLDRATIETWRARATEAGVGVDAWLGLLVERELVRGHLCELGLGVENLVAEAERSLEVTRLAPTDALRQWSAQLSGQGGGLGAAPPDELPSAVLAERLLAQIAPSPVAHVVTTAVEGKADEEALLLERAATASGLTMETWAYLATLRRHTPEPA
jgi:hypothetical protein